MTSEPESEYADLMAPLGASGFPLQTAVAAAIRGMGLYHVEEEIAWCHQDGSDRFLDLVAVGKFVRVLIECKKSAQDKFIFLLPTDIQTEITQDIQCVYLHQIQDSTRRGAVAWGTGTALPMSHQAMYCVAKSASSNRLLETDAQALVRATEAYARDRYHDFKPQNHETTSVPCIPVLVTTSPLFVARYSAADVSLASGIYKARAEDLTPARYVRFTKQFTTSSRVDVRHRTVFVVQATALVELLTHMTTANMLNPGRGVVLAA